MSDKPVAGLVAFLVVAPLCGLCLFGPALFTWAAVWMSGRASGLGAVAATGLAMIAAIVVFGFVRRRRLRRGAALAQPPARPPEPAE